MTLKFRINTAVVSILLITLFSGMTWAQNQRPQGPPPVPNQEQIEKMVDDLGEKLNLSGEQSKKVLKLHTDHFDKVKENQEKGRENREAHRETMDKLRINFEKDVKAVLTKEQQKKYDDYLKEQEKKRRKPPQGRR